MITISLQALETTTLKDLDVFVTVDLLDRTGSKLHIYFDDLQDVINWAAEISIQASNALNQR